MCFSIWRTILKQVPVSAAVFAKNEKANLSRSEQAALVEMAKQIASLYGEN